MQVAVIYWRRGERNLVKGMAQPHTSVFINTVEGFMRSECKMIRVLGKQQRRFLMRSVRAA